MRFIYTVLHVGMNSALQLQLLHSKATKYLILTDMQLNLHQIKDFLRTVHCNYQLLFLVHHLMHKSSNMSSNQLFYSIKKKHYIKNKEKRQE